VRKESQIVSWKKPATRRSQPLAELNTVHARYPLMGVHRAEANVCRVLLCREGNLVPVWVVTPTPLEASDIQGYPLSLQMELCLSNSGALPRPNEANPFKPRNAKLECGS